MTYQADVLASSPAGYWRLGELSGNSAADGSGNARNGTWVGVPALGQPGAIISSSTNTAAGLDGTSHVTVMPWTVWDGAAALSFEAWVRLPAGAEARYVAWRLNQVSLLVSATRVSFGLATSVGGFAVQQLDVVLTADVWHHIVWVYNGTHQLVYLDGVLVGSTAKTGTVTAGTGTLLIGPASAASWSWTATMPSGLSGYCLTMSAGKN